MDYYKLSAKELGKGGKIPLLKLGDSGEVFYELALEMINTIKENNGNNKPTVIICPVGPVGQYPIFIRLINNQKISLKNCWFINMDEYLTRDYKFIDYNHKLSFRRFMDEQVFALIEPNLLPAKDQRLFPDPENLKEIPELIEKMGGIDLAVGGIGINGHLAFNEPDSSITIDDFAQLTVRTQEIAAETIVANAIGDLNGAIEAMPLLASTLGMKEILSAKKIRLGVFRDWHRSVIRRALYDDITTEFPITLCQQHPDTLIFANANASEQPY